MNIMPFNLRVAGLSRGGEPPDTLNFGGEDKQDHEHSSIQPLPPLALESSAFRGTVWAHMDPCRRGRLNLEDFEERLSVLPLATADNVSTLCFPGSWCKCRLDGFGLRSAQQRMTCSLVCINTEVCTIVAGCKLCLEQQFKSAGWYIQHYYAVFTMRRALL